MTDPKPLTLEERTYWEMRRHHLKMEEIANHQRRALEEIAFWMRPPITEVEPDVWDREKTT